jgi:hypothetical protein
LPAPPNRLVTCRRGLQGGGIDRTKIAKLIRQQQALASELEWMRKRQEATEDEERGWESPVLNLPEQGIQSPNVDFSRSERSFSAPRSAKISSGGQGGISDALHARPPRSGERRVRRGDTEEDRRQMAEQVREAQKNQSALHKFAVCAARRHYVYAESMYMYVY